ncbi:MAG: DUF2288 domain-containing protein [Myxococcota bacterium]
MREKLVGEVMGCTWADLEPHHERGALLVVSPDLDLVEVAEAVATDGADRVGAWITVGRLGRPTEGLVERWSAGVARFQFVIVQPYVLAQELAVAEG